jgi:hypothetical protein
MPQSALTASCPAFGDISSDLVPGQLSCNSLTIREFLRLPKLEKFAGNSRSSCAAGSPKDMTLGRCGDVRTSR